MKKNLKKLLQIDINNKDKPINLQNDYLNNTKGIQVMNEI